MKTIDLQKLFEQFLFRRTGGSSVVKSKKIRLIALAILIVIAVILEYLFLIPLNFRSSSFIMLLIVILMAYCFIDSTLSLSFNKLHKSIFLVVFVLSAYLIIGQLSGAKFFNARNYQQQITVYDNLDFSTNVEAVNLNKIPFIDRDSALKLGDKKLGEITAIGSQFAVGDAYTQTTIRDELYRVSPLEYQSFIKWVQNSSIGIPGYIRVNTTNTSDVVLMVYEDGVWKPNTGNDLSKITKGIKYSPSAYFNYNLARHLRFNYPTYIFDQYSFEVDDDDNPYFVASYIIPKIGIFSGIDTIGVVVVDAVTGECNDYKVGDIPDFVNRVYSAEIIIEQLDNWGIYKEGFWNTIFGQKNMLTTSGGYNYVTLEGQTYLFTGLTSLGNEDSTVGFVYVNLKTKEANFYKIGGADEFAAMESAEGKVQHLGYVASFPVLLNVGGQPTYFIPLKDNASLVKQYAFVSVINYQLVATGDTISVAQKEYARILLESSLNVDTGETKEFFGVVSEIKEAIIDGNTAYFIKLLDDDTLYVASIKINLELPLLKVGDTVSLTYYLESNEQNSEIIDLLSIKILE